MEQNPYAAPSYHADAAATVVTGSQGALPWFAVGQTKLMVMSVCTAGIYLVYWFERQFRFQKHTYGEKTWPLARALFSVFFTHDLFRRVQMAAREKGLQHAWSAGSEATTFVVLVILDRLIDRVGGKLATGTTAVALSLIGIVFTAVVARPVVRVQGTINTILEQTQPNFIRNERFTAVNWLVISLGVMVLALAAFGTLMPDTDSVEGDSSTVAPD